MKTLKKITVLMAIMLFIAFHGFSQNASSTNSLKDSQITQTATNPTHSKFVDKNKDGICDNHQANIKNVKGANFIDKNGDGICDNRQGTGLGKGSPKNCGMGYQHRNGPGKGNCCGNGCGNQHQYGRGNQNTPASGPQKLNSK